ncbi:PREDICTED: uncharacterized protein LOC109150755 [Ipomoea nil]|uniref:uncharacterized protein LOC109150755 n=1 Tax=Ipomoea nil TaxID=35883 RepID=UPI0009015A03|nr:PREDICTED: uncharacterized protein LOC109150755 [Ipomoea nil]
MADVNDGQTLSSSRTVTEVSPAPPLHAPNMLQKAHPYVSLKLSAIKFLFWKAQLVPFLRGQNLFGFVDGSHLCPPKFVASTSSAPPVSNSAHAQWVQQDQSILGILISSMAEEVLYLAIGHKTSRNGDSLPVDYLGRAWLLVEQLAQAGRPVGFDEQNLHIFRGLRPEYRALVSSLTTKDAPLTIPQVADLLNAHRYVFQEDVLPPVAASLPVAMYV